VAGGLDGSSLTDRWYIFALFSDIRTIRNYFGDVIAHELLIKISVVAYLFAISVPYGMLYIMEQLYSSQITLYTSLIEAIIFAISFSMYTLFVEELEHHFILAYSDNRESRVFSNTFVGPYIRNILTDELNEFEEDKGFMFFLRNLACMPIFGVLIGIFAGLFHGCRMFLLQIHDPLYGYQGRYFSLSHLLAYSIYLIVGDIFKIQMYDKVVALLIWIKNPSSDVVERSLRSFFTFYYLLLIEVIPLVFFFIIEPLQRTSCYSVNCDDEFYYYIYARFLFNIIMVCINFARAALILVRKAKNKIKEEINEDENKVEIITFQTKLKGMLSGAIKESEKESYTAGLTQDILSIFAYAFYCTEVPLSGVIALGIVATIYVVVRIQLLYNTRRPINKSEPIIEFSTYCKAIYLIGCAINIWVNTFALNYIERYYHFVINVAPQPLTEESLFLIKLIFTVIFFIIISFLGIIGRKVALAFSPKLLVRTPPPN
jgi:hypothetical protein